MTLFIDLPFELLVAVLAYIGPREALRLSSVCSRLKTVLYSIEWAAETLACHVSPHIKRTFLLANHDLLFLNGPPQLQTTYARMYLMPLGIIVWSGSDIGYKAGSAALPAALCSLTNLTILTLSACKRVGSIPSELKNLKLLRALDFSNNQLSGLIPSDIGSLVNLEYLILSNNEFEGPIPSSLANLKGLTKLLLNGNKLEGHLPEFLGQLKSLQQLALCGNRLEGNIPSSFGQLSQLVLLDLSHNSLSGRIPRELKNLEKLTSLCLNDNHLIGDIPVEITRLHNLKINVSNNLLRQDLTSGIQLHEALGLVLGIVLVLDGVFNFLGR